MRLLLGMYDYAYKLYCTSTADSDNASNKETVHGLYIFAISFVATLVGKHPSALLFNQQNEATFFSCHTIMLYRHYNMPGSFSEELISSARSVEDGIIQT